MQRDVNGHSVVGKMLDAKIKIKKKETCWYTPNIERIM
jgi:hypothetical protein